MTLSLCVCVLGGGGGVHINFSTTLLTSAYAPNGLTAALVDDRAGKLQAMAVN